jgi:hypothetical protein
MADLLGPRVELDAKFCHVMKQILVYKFILNFWVLPHIMAVGLNVSYLNISKTSS